MTSRACRASTADWDWTCCSRKRAGSGWRSASIAVSASGRLSVDSGGLDSLTKDLRGRGVEVEGPVEHDGGDRSAYFFDPAGNRVELWDFFQEGDGAEGGVMALTEGD
jgi:hypothetical protein